MKHEMKLVDFAFKAIKEGKKDIEIRLNDEKRQLIKINDIIEFKNIDTGEILRVIVINLYKFDNFKDLFNSFEHSRFGLNDDDNEDIMNRFYTPMEQEKYGALGIQIKLISDN